jgi:hypothetical protein
MLFCVDPAQGRQCGARSSLSHNVTIPPPIRHSGVGRNPVKQKIPAQPDKTKGTFDQPRWIPAYAGMTGIALTGRNDEYCVGWQE